MEVAGPLGTPLGLAQLKRGSPRGEAGTSGKGDTGHGALKMAPGKSGLHARGEGVHRVILVVG